VCGSTAKTTLAVVSGEIKGPIGESFTAAFDNGAIEVRWSTQPGSGDWHDLAGSGEGDLGGEYIADGDWRDSYARQPHYPG
jgi:hypothetical protein